MTTATLQCNSNATAMVMDGNGRCNGYAMATIAMERGSNGGGTPTSNSCHRRMLTRYGRASVHLELSSFGYKYGAPLYCLRDGFTYAHPLPPLDVRDLDHAPGHVSKFNGLSYLVRWPLLNPPGGRVNDNRWYDCDSDCNNEDVYRDDGGGVVDDDGKRGRQWMQSDEMMCSSTR